MQLPNILSVFLALVFALASLILCLGIVWRTKNRLVTVFKFYSMAFGLLSARQILSVLSVGKPGDWIWAFMALDVFIGLFFMLGTWKMSQIVRRLNNESGEDVDRAFNS